MFKPIPRHFPARLRNRMRRHAAYKEFFATEAGRVVLADLAVFCNEDMDLMGADPFLTANNIGKHRVMQRIRSIIGLSEVEVLNMARAQRAEDQSDD